MPTSDEIESLVQKFEATQVELGAHREALKHLGSVVERMRASGENVERAERTFAMVAAVVGVLDDEAAVLLKRMEDHAAYRLRSGGQVGTIGTVQAATSRSPGATISEAKIHAPTLFQAHLIERGLSLPEWVASKSNLKLKENTAQSWVKPGSGGRRIPRIWAERIAAEFNDLRLSKSENWPKGIRG